MRAALVQAHGIEFVAEASSDGEVDSLTAQVRWDVALVSYSLLENLPTEAKASLSTAESRARLLVLGIPDWDGLLYCLWRTGALGCVDEDAASETIVQAVEAASHGRLLWTADQIARAQRWWDDVGSKLKALTPREREVLDLVSEGLTNRQVAERLVLTQNTVQTHVHHILSKLGANNRVEAARVLARGRNVYRTTPGNH